MAGLSLRNIYKVYPGRNTQKKGIIKTVKGIIKKSEQQTGAVEKRSGNFVAVKNFNMEIEDGEFIVFVGPSGCGKSTTLRMIAGLEDISSGELYIDGKLVNDVDPKNRDIAMVFQSYALYPHMTAQQIIEFALKLRKIPEEKKDKDGNPVLETDKKKIKELKEKIKTVEKELLAADDPEFKEGLLARKSQLETDLKYYIETPVQAYTYRHMSKEEISEKVQWAAKILNIEELLDNRPAEMSGGQRQRIALGRAMVRDPKVFLLDEPLSNLDAKLRTAMRSEIVKLHNELKTTFIYVTHDQIEAMTMGTRIVVMKAGIVQQIDTPTNLYDYPDNKFVAGFIGTPQMNFFRAELVKNADGYFVETEGKSFPVSKKARAVLEANGTEPKSVVLGVRPEHITVLKEGEKQKTAQYIAAKVNIAEMMGSEFYVHVSSQSSEKNVIIRVPTMNLSEKDKRALTENGEVKYTFPAEAMHLFDAESGANLIAEERRGD